MPDTLIVADNRTGRSIGSVNNVPDYIKRVKNGEVRLMGFGHRVYKSYDPRARIIKETAHQVFEVIGQNPLNDVALELERIALEDDYFVERRCTRMSISTPGSSTRPWNSPAVYSPCCSRSRAPRAGSPSGSNPWRTRSCASRAPGSCTPDTGKGISLRVEERNS